MRKCAVEYLSSVRLHKDFFKSSPLHFDVFLLMRGGGGDESKQSYASRGVCLETMILMIKVMKTIMSAGSKSGLPLIRF